MKLRYLSASILVSCQAVSEQPANSPAHASSAGPPSSTTVVTMPLVDAAPAESTPASGPNIIEPARLAKVGCRFGPGEGTLRGELRFVVDELNFAELGGKVAVESIEIADDGQRAFAIVDDGRVRLAAEVVPTSVRVAPTGAAHDGWLEIHSAALAEVNDGRATLDFRFPAGFEEATPVVVELPCASLTPLTDESLPEWGLAKLKPSQRAPLSKTRGGAVVGHLVSPPPNKPNEYRIEVKTNLHELEERAGSVRVRSIGSDASVVGWIPKGALDPDESGVVKEMMDEIPTPEGETLTCSRDVGLLVEHGGQPYRVGILHAGAAILSRLGEDGRRSVMVRNTIIDRAFTNGAHPFVAPADAPSCSVDSGPGSAPIKQ